MADMFFDGVVDRLKAARDSRELVEVSRDIPDADRIEGYVLELGAGWALIGSLNWDAVAVDQYVAIRVQDVSDVQAIENFGFPRRAMELAGRWPPASPSEAVCLDSTAELVGSVARQTPLVNIQDERDAPDACYIGVVVELTETAVALVEVTPEATWEDDVNRWNLADLTRVQFGGRYEAALWAVAGPPNR